MGGWPCSSAQLDCSSLSGLGCQLVQIDSVCANKLNGTGECFQALEINHLSFSMVWGDGQLNSMDTALPCQPASEPEQPWAHFLEVPSHCPLPLWTGWSQSSPDVEPEQGDCPRPSLPSCTSGAPQLLPSLELCEPSWWCPTCPTWNTDGISQNLGCPKSWNTQQAYLSRCKHTDKKPSLNLETILIIFCSVHRCRCAKQLHQREFLYHLCLPHRQESRAATRGPPSGSPPICL